MESVFLLIILALIYLLPTIIAFSRGHVSRWGIFATNLLLGWSGIIWLVALIWSLSNKGQQNVTVVNVGSGNQYNVNQSDKPE